MTGAVLAQLMAQATREGGDLLSLRAIVEEAGDLGATRALTRLGVADEKATADLAELRALLGTWRDAKKSAWKAVLGWAMRLVTALLLAGLAMRLGLAAWLE